MSMLSAAWNRNKKALVQYVGAFAAGGPAAVGAIAINDARKEAGRAIARTGASPEAQATLQAQADNALNIAGTAAGVQQPTFLGPLGTQGQQRVAIGGATASVNQIAIVGIGLALVVLILVMHKR